MHLHRDPNQTPPHPNSSFYKKPGQQIYEDVDLVNIEAHCLHQLSPNNSLGRLLQRTYGILPLGMIKRLVDHKSREDKVVISRVCIRVSVLLKSALKACLVLLEAVHIVYTAAKLVQRMSGRMVQSFV